MDEFSVLDWNDHLFDFLKLFDHSVDLIFVSFEILDSAHFTFVEDIFLCLVGLFSLKFIFLLHSNLLCQFRVLKFKCFHALHELVTVSSVLHINNCLSNEIIIEFT